MISPARRILVACALAALAVALRPHPRRTAEGQPPTALVGAGLGGLNGLLVDLLWLRATDLEERGREVELLQTLRLMTALQPRQPGLLCFRAWRTGVNLADRLSDADERWRWLTAAFAALDEASRANPTAALVPQTRAELLGSRVAEPLSPVAAGHRERWFGLWRERLGDGSAVALRAWLAGHANSLHPAHVAAVEARYGPFDWRTPEAHQVYWAHLARDLGGEPVEPRRERLVYQALWSAAQRGRLLEGTDGSLIPVPEPRLVPVVEAELERLVATSSEPEPWRLARASFDVDAALLDHLAGRPAKVEARWRRLVGSPLLPAWLRGPDDLLLWAAGWEPGGGEEALAFVEAALLNAWRFVALAEPALARGYATLARLAAAREPDLPPWPELARRTLAEAGATFDPVAAARLRALGPAALELLETTP